MQGILAQIIGFIATILIIISLQVKSKKALYLLINGSAALIFSISFILLEAYSASFINMIGVILAFTMYFHDKKSIPVHKLTIAFFVIATVTGTVFTYTNIYSLIPLLGGLLYILIVTSKNMKNVRLCTVAQATTWITYDIIIGAYTLALAPIFALTSSIVGIIRHDISKSKN